MMSVPLHSRQKQQEFCSKTQTPTQPNNSSGDKAYPMKYIANKKKEDVNMKT